MMKYKVEIQWSEVDNVYVVNVPGLPGCKTHGSTFLEAAENAKEAIVSYTGEDFDLPCTYCDGVGNRPPAIHPCYECSGTGLK